MFVQLVVQMWVQGHKKIWLDLPLMIDSAFCAGAAMITFGAILGKVSPTQLTYLLVLEVSQVRTKAHVHVRHDDPHGLKWSMLVMMRLKTNLP